MANQLFDEVFNKSAIYEMFFFNVKGVLIYQTLTELEKENKSMFDRWKYISKTKHGFDMNTGHYTAGAMRDETPEYAQKIYEENAVHYPEFSKIVAITFATVYYENDKLKRFFKQIVDNDESIVLKTFFDVLHQLSSDGAKSTPQQFPILCGHNIIGYDIPFLIKRFIVNKDKFEVNKQLPYILKRVLNIKPWESGVIDTVNVWKFNGFEYTPLMLISDFMGLKRTTDLLTHEDLSKYYWKNISINPEETLKLISLQSATQTNLVIQLMNELRLF
jgi:hypothetical protein